MDDRERQKAFRGQSAVALSGILLELPNLIVIYTLAFLSGSLMLLMDAFDSTSNIIQSGILFFLSRRMRKSEAFQYDYGMGKIEAFGSFVAGVLLYAGLIAVIVSSVIVILNPAPPERILFFAVAVKAVTVIVDFVMLRSQRRVEKTASSKLFSSGANLVSKNLLFDCTALGVLLIAAVFRGYSGVAYFEPAACVICSLVLIIRGLGPLRESVCDLLDKTLDEQTQLKILGCLTPLYDEFEEFYGIRSRRSGEFVYIDLVIGFSPECTYASMRETLAVFDEKLRGQIPNCIVAIIITTHQ
jgi:cation diffusion facilitator family transporter